MLTSTLDKEDKKAYICAMFSCTLLHPLSMDSKLGHSQGVLVEGSSSRVVRDQKMTILIVVVNPHAGGFCRL